jgi:sensor histidine kinase regulating citrate/malate metabolism
VPSTDDLVKLVSVASPGQTVVLRVTEMRSEAEMDQLQAQLEEVQHRTAVEFVVLTHGIEVEHVDAERIDRLMRAVSTMNGWLLSAQTGWGAQDVRGIDDILEGKK